MNTLSFHAITPTLISEILQQGLISAQETFLQKQFHLPESKGKKQLLQ